MKLHFLIRFWALHAKASLINLPTPAPTPDSSATPIPGSEVSNLSNQFVHLLYSLAYPVAFAAILYTAYLLISSQGKPEAYVNAKKNITYILTGVFLIIFAVIIVRFFLSFLV